MSSADDFLKGDYRLISFQVLSDGQWRDLGYSGCLRYDGQGQMSAQGMRRDLPAMSKSGQRKGPGGFAYWGSVEVFPEQCRVVHHVEGCTSHPEWVGGIQERFYELEDRLLTLMVKDQNGRVTGRLRWEKHHPNQ